MTPPFFCFNSELVPNTDSELFYLYFILKSAHEVFVSNTNVLCIFSSLGYRESNIFKYT